MTLARRLVVNIASGILLRGINLATTLLIVPISLKALGSNDYGTLAIILSATVFFAYADLGLGLGVVNRIASNDGADAKSAISRAWAFLVLFGLAIGVIGGLLPIAHYLNTDLNPHILRNWAIAICSIGLGLPTALSQRVLFGLQRNLEAGLWVAAGKIGSVIGVVISSKLELGIQFYIFSILGIPTVVGWINTAALFLISRPDLKPVSTSVFSRDVLDDIKLGLQFTVLQIAVFAETGIDNFFVGLFNSSSTVAHYDIICRIFNYVPALISIAAFPLWPAIRNAIASGNLDWAKRVLSLGYLAAFAIAACSATILATYHSQIAEAWTHTAYAANFPLAVGLGLVSVTSALSMIQSMHLNAENRIAVQAKFQMLAIPVLIVCKLIGLYKFGPIALPWIISAFITSRVVWLYAYTKKIGKS